MEKDTILRNLTIILVVVGIVCLVGIYFVPPFLEQYVLASGPVTLNENTQDYVNQSYAAGFNLKYGDKCTVAISNNLDTNISETITVTIAFVRYADYIDKVQSGAIPSALNELYLSYKTPHYPAATSTTYNNAAISVGENTRTIFEFMGAGSGSAIWSNPGSYVVVIWLDNSGSGEFGTFDLQITVDGQGDVIRTALTWIGGIALAAGIIVGIAYFILMNRR